jgi:AcrR family transcriptional regulator
LCYGRAVPTTAPQPHGRARSRQTILRASLELCREVGFARTTMDAIARRAGVGKQTVYRWWPSKAAVVMDAVNEEASEALGFADTGDVVADLRANMRSVVALLTSDMAGVFAGLIGAAQTDPALARVLHEVAVEPPMALCRDRLAKARQNGEIRADVDLDAMVELLYSAFYFRLLLRAEPVSDAQADTILDLCFAGLRP